MKFAHSAGACVAEFQGFEMASESAKGSGQVLGNYGLLHDVLDYELVCAERYRRYVSLVMIKSTSPDSSVRRILSDRIRSSDLLAEKNSHLVVLMSETDSDGAFVAIDRYRTFCENHPLWFSLVTFPQDAGTAEEFVTAAERRLDAAIQEEPGAVVSTG